MMKIVLIIKLVVWQKESVSHYFMAKRLEFTKSTIA